MRKSAVQATYFTNKIGQNQTNPPNIIAFTQEKYLDNHGEIFCSKQESFAVQ